MWARKMRGTHHAQPGIPLRLAILLACLTSTSQWVVSAPSSPASWLTAGPAGSMLAARPGAGRLLAPSCCVRSLTSTSSDSLAEQFAAMSVRGRAAAGRSTHRNWEQEMWSAPPTRDRCSSVALSMVQGSWGRDTVRRTLGSANRAKLNDNSPSTAATSVNSGVVAAQKDSTKNKQTVNQTILESSVPAIAKIVIKKKRGMKAEDGVASQPCVSGRRTGKRVSNAHTLHTSTRTDE